MKKSYPLNKEGFNLVVKRDKDPQSPDTWGNTDLFLVYHHRQFTVNREGFEPEDVYRAFKGSTGFIFDNYWIFTVYAYIHSGVSLSLSPQGNRFDVSSTGFILVEKETGVLSIGTKPVMVTKDEATKYAEGLIETWNTYLSGDVWGFQVVEDVSCSHCGHVDKEHHYSYSGFYGEHNDELIADMLNHIEYDLAEKPPTDAQKSSTMS